MNGQGRSVALFLNTPIYHDADSGRYSADQVNLLDFVLANSDRFERLVLVVPVGEGEGEVPLDLPSNVSVVGFDYYRGPFGLLERAHRILPQLVRIAASDTVAECDAVGAVAPSTVSAFTVPVCRLLRDQPTFLLMRGLKRQTVEHSLSAAPLKRRFLATVVGGYDALTRRLLTRDRTLLLTIGEYTDRLVDRGYPADRIVSLFPLVDDALVTERTTTRADAHRVLFVGRLSGEKGVGDLLRAVQRIAHETDGEVELHVVGDGPEAERLEALAASLDIESRTVFHGFVPHGDRLWDHYDEADVLVLPSYTEGLPRVIGEGMARGLPIVATRVGGIPAFIEDGESGLLVDPGDVDGLQTAIQRVLEDKDLRRSLSAASHETASAVTFGEQGAALVAALESHLFDTERTGQASSRK